jgi:enoyl-CoA hydratase
MTMTYKEIIFEVNGNIATMILNRPDKLNAVTSDMIEERRSILDEVRGNDKIKVLIITGKGRAFSAGADLSLIDQLFKMSESPSTFRLFIHKLQGFLNDLEKLEKPVIAAINGLAVGGGCELAMACDIRIASENAKFGSTETSIGIIPDAGGTQRLVRLVGLGKAKELILTGELIDAKEAERIGLVNKVVKHEDLDSMVKDYANRLLKKAPLALGLAKTVMLDGLQTGTRVGMEFEVYAQSILVNTEDFKEGVKAFLEKRTPIFKGR